MQHALHPGTWMQQEQAADVALSGVRKGSLKLLGALAPLSELNSLPEYQAAASAVAVIAASAAAAGM